MRCEAHYFFVQFIINTNLVFGIKIVYICFNQSILTMSRELTEFSELIDEQFELPWTNQRSSFWSFLFGWFR